ncbi:MAG: type II toxin-antitoxin system prevent-host-death family antitoxin [Pseudomonadota bacterium]
MNTFNIHEAKTNFSQLINQALAGEQIIIARGNKPLIKLVPFEEELTPRHGGQLKGMMHIAEDFDAPLPENILNSFYGKENE